MGIKKNTFMAKLIVCYYLKFVFIRVHSWFLFNRKWTQINTNGHPKKYLYVLTDRMLFF